MSCGLWSVICYGFVGGWSFLKGRGWDWVGHGSREFSGWIQDMGSYMGRWGEVKGDFGGWMEALSGERGFGKVEVHGVFMYR